MFYTDICNAHVNVWYIHISISLSNCTIIFQYQTAKSFQSCLTLCDPIDGSPPGSPVPGILQAGILEWAAISSSNATTYIIWVIFLFSQTNALLLTDLNLTFLAYVLNCFVNKILQEKLIYCSAVFVSFILFNII